MKRSWASLTFLLLGASLSAQTVLGLEEALRSAEANSRQLKIQDQAVALSRAERAGGSSAFLPRVSASYTGMYTDDPLNAFGFKLRHRTVSPLDFQPDLLNHPDALSDFNARLAIAQPVLNFDAFAGRAVLGSKAKAVEHQRAFAAEHLALTVRTGYYNLQYLHEAGKAVAGAVAAYEESLRNTENMMEQGLVKHADLLMVKVGLADMRIREIELRNALAELSDNLSWMMGRPTGTVYLPEGSLALAPPMDSDGGLNMQREDLLAMNEGIEAQRKMLSMQRGALLPRVNAFGEYNLNSKEALDFEPSSYLVGIALSLSLFNGNETRSKIAQQKISIEKATQEMQLHVEQNSLQLLQLRRELTALQEKIALAALASEQAHESARIVEDRYNEGLEKTSDLLIAQSNGLEKQIGHLRAILAHNLARLQVEFLTTP